MPRNSDRAKHLGGREHAGRRAAGRGVLRLIGHYFRFNLSANMAYKGSFIIQVFGMALNNSAFIVFWFYLFQQIGGEIKGFEFNDVMFLWALAATGFGSSVVLFGNTPYISRIIYTGELDVYLLQPKPVLPNLLVSRMIVSGWGDIAYGLILFAATQTLTLGSWALFLFFSVMMMLVLTAVRTFYHSLTFFFGNAESFAQMAGEMTITFMLYPGSIFKGAPMIVLHSLIPAALVGYIPVRVFKEFDPVLTMIVVLADLVVVGAAVGLFRLGLRRYESGNRMATRL
jgi:viologen exporter family transport system permease protein